MKTKYASSAAMTGVLFLALASSPKVSAQRFTFAAIDVPNASATFARGVANDGTVVGFYYDQSLTPHGFLRSPDGTLTFPIDYVSASSTVVGTVVNKIDPQGETVVGWWFDGASVVHGLLINLSSSTAVSFDFPSPGALTTIPNGINRSGEISGNYEDSAGISHGFTANVSCLSQAQCYQSFDFPGGFATELGSVNDSGDIVGDYFATNSKVISFRLSGGNITTLSAPSAATVSARAINNLQQIVGSYGNAFPIFQTSPEGQNNGLFKTPGALHGFLITPTGRATTINFPGADQTGIGAINDSGTIVGHYTSPGFVSHGFVAVATN
jgi:hypothetical protein